MSSLYLEIRSNFLKQYSIDNDIYAERDFREELAKYDGVIVDLKPDLLKSSYVTDMLGMCGHTEIHFKTEQKYTWFLLRWT